MSEQDPERLVVRREDLPPEAAVSPIAADRPASAPVDALARLSFVLGVISIAFLGVALGPIAMIIGVVAALRSRGGGGRSQNLALGGILTGALGMMIWIGILWWLIPTHRDSSGTSNRQMHGAEGVVDEQAIARSPEPIRIALLANVRVVKERRDTSGWTPMVTGSGTVVAVDHDRCYVLTCRHVVAPGSQGGDERFYVRWVDGRSKESRVEWMGDHGLDLAILSAESLPSAPEVVVAPLGAPEEARVGQPVFAIGNPLNYDASLVTGVISAVRTIGEDGAEVKQFQVQIPLNSGNSGGGLYTAEGRLIAIDSWTLPKGSVEGIGFAISLENLWTALAHAPIPVSEALRRVRLQSQREDPGRDVKRSD